MFNFFGALGQLGRMLPGYMQGERQAVQDNWKDLQNYSQVQASQLGNLFTEATFNPRVNMQYDAAAQSRMATEQAGMQNEYYQAAHPGRLEAAAITGQFAPLFATQNAMLQAMYPWQYPGIGFTGLMGGLGGYGGMPNPVQQSRSGANNPSLLGR